MAKMQQPTLVSTGVVANFRITQGSNINPGVLEYYGYLPGNFGSLVYFRNYIPGQQPNMTLGWMYDVIQYDAYAPTIHAYGSYFRLTNLSSDIGSNLLLVLISDGTNSYNSQIGLPSGYGYGSGNADWSKLDASQNSLGMGSSGDAIYNIIRY